MAMPGGRVGRAVLELGVDQGDYTSGLATARAILNKFEADAAKVQPTFRNLVQGMSAAGKEASASTKLLAGMGLAGRQAATAQLEAARASQTFGQRLQGLQSGLTASSKALFENVKQLGLFGGALGVGAILSASRAVAGWASNLEDLSAETGTSVEQLQALDYVAAGVGLTIEEVNRLMVELTRRVAGGDDSAVGALDKLGISTQKFLQMSADERLFALDAAFRGLTNDVERLDTAVDAFGTRNGPKALRLLNGELQVLTEQAKKTGAVLEEELVEKAGRFDDFWAQAWRRFRAETVRTIDHLIVYMDRASERSAGFAATLVNGIMAAREAAGQLEAMLPGAAAAGGMKRAPELRPAGVPSEADQNELDRRVNDRIAASKKAQDKEAEDRERAKREAQQASDQDAAERKSAYQKDIEARQQVRDQVARTVEEQIAIEREAVLEGMRGNEEFRNAKLDALNDEIDAYEEMSDRRNAIGLSFMQADKERLDEQKRRLDELREYWHMAADSITFSFTNNLADMIVGLRGFKDGFIGMWRDIRMSVANILSQMVADFIGGYVRRLVTAFAGSSLAGIGTGAAGAGGAAAAAAGAGGAGTAAATAGGAGGGGAIAGLLSNPATWAIGAGVLLGWGIGKKGLFRGGEEALKVNPRRDKFVGQFGPSGTGPGSGLATMASVVRHEAMVRALLRADTENDYNAAQAAIVGRLSGMGKRVKSFAMGGFIPPGVVQPAVLHGGRFGEDIVPRRNPRPSDQMTHQRPQIVIHAPLTVQGILSADTAAEVHRKHLIRLQNEAMMRNAQGAATEVRRVINGRS